MRANGEDGKELPPEVERVALESATPPRADAFLAPVSIDERKDPLGPHPSRNGRRSSDKGFLAMAEAEYLKILDWLARDRAAGKRGATPQSVVSPCMHIRLHAGMAKRIYSVTENDLEKSSMRLMTRELHAKLDSIWVALRSS